MGSAALFLRGVTGQSVAVELNHTGFDTGIELQVTSAQRRDGLTHYPIRKREQSISIDCIFASYEAAEAVSLKLHDHWRYCLSVDDPPPMLLVLKETPTWLSYRGFVEQAGRGDERFQAAYVRTYSMRLITAERPGVSEVTTNAPYLPTGRDVTEYGMDAWYDQDLATALFFTVPRSR